MTKIKTMFAIACAMVGFVSFGDYIEGARVGTITGESWGYMNQYSCYNVYVFTNTTAEISVEITKAGSAELFIVGGGGSGGNVIGGGGAGGTVVSTNFTTLVAGTYAINVGAKGLHTKGVANWSRDIGGGKGGDSSFTNDVISIVAIGGGGGNSYGAAGEGVGGGTVAGYGGTGALYGLPNGANGGVGVESDIVDGTSVIIYGAGGGRGGGDGTLSGVGGSAYAGDGGANLNWQEMYNLPEGQGGAGVDGTGSGGGGGGWPLNESERGGGDGGSGIVVLKVNTLDFSDNIADVVCTEVTSIGATYATIGYQVISFGDGEAAKVEFEFGTESGKYTRSVVLGNSVGASALAKEVRLFTKETKYYARLKAQGDGENAAVGYSSEFTFTTGKAPAMMQTITGDYTVNQYGAYKAYVFKDTSSTASITLSRAGNVDFMMVAGGGAGGDVMGAGGGAGEMKVVYNASLEANQYNITVGAGGLDQNNYWWSTGGNGEDTIFGDYVAKGGGGGGSWAWGGDQYVGIAGGSGGGSTRGHQAAGASLAGSDGHVGYGHAGGNGSPTNGDWPGGGGGAGSAGEIGQSDRPGNGGEGMQNDFETGVMKWYAAGGGGAGGNSGTSISGNGGNGIGGDGGNSTIGYEGCPGVDGTGSGGGGSAWNGAWHAAGNGGSGIVVVRIPVDTTDLTADIRLVDVNVTGAHSASFTWDLINAGAGDTAEVRLEYGTVQGLYTSSITLAENAALEEATASFGEFSEGTTYYARIIAAGSGEGALDGYSTPFTFTTSAATEPIAIEVSEITRTDNDISAKLTFGEGIVKGMNVAVNYGASATVEGLLTESSNVFGDTIGEDETTRIVEFTVGENDKFFVFSASATAGDEYYSYVMSLNDAEIIEATAPVLANDFTLDGTLGDHIAVTGLLTSSGAGDEASVKLELSLVEAMTDSFSIDLGDFGAGEIEATAFVNDPNAANYINPGLTYYCRLVATGEDGLVVVTPVKSVATLGGCAIAPTLGLSAVNSEITMSANLSAFGAGETATIEYYLGDSADSLTKVGTTNVTAAGSYSFVVRNNGFGTVYAKAKVINECETKSFTAATDVNTITLTDGTTWTIVAADGVLDWSDAASWSNSWGTPGVDVGNQPGNGANVVLDTNPDDATLPVKVKIVGTISLNSITFSKADMTAVIEGTENDYTSNESIINVNYVYGNSGQNITLKNTQLLFNLGIYQTFPLYTGTTLTLDGTYMMTTSEMTIAYPDVTFKLINGAYFLDRFWHPRVVAANFHIVIDDSTFAVWDTPIEVGAEGTDFVIDFYGARAKYRPSTWGFLNGCATAPKFIFHVPEGGYANDDPPITYYVQTHTFGQGSSQDFKFIIADDSPMFKGGASKLTTKIAYSTVGYDSHVVLESESRAVTWRYDDAGQNLYIDYSKKGLAIIIK